MPATQAPPSLPRLPSGLPAELPPRQRWALILGIALFYFLTGRFGLSLATADGAASLTWPPSGIAVAALLLGGRGLWPAVWLGAFAVNSTFGLSPGAAFIIACGNTLEAIVARLLLERVIGSAHLASPFTTVRHTLLFILSTAMLAPAVSALAGMTALALDYGSFVDARRLWLLWWLGDMMGVLLLTPPLLLLAQRWLWRHHSDRVLQWGYTGRHREWLVVFLCALLVSVFIYAGHLPPPLSDRLGFVPYLFVLWTALRMSPLATVATSLAVSSGAIAGIIGNGQTSAEVIADVMFLYAFLFILTTSALLITAVVSERRLALIDAERARELAQSASTQKSRFLANMSHEIRTPLNGIIGMTSLLQDDISEPAAREKLRIIQSSANSLLHVLNDILDHARIEAGKLDIVPRVFSPADLARDVTGLFQGQAELKGIRLRARLDGNLPATVHADDNRLRQVLVNVLSNAVKFTEQGEVLLQMMRDYARPGHLLVVISDTGIGIPAAAMAEIFEPFTQVDGSSTRRHGGSGLGLTISKQLVERMGGTLNMASTPGVGTQVTISLPAPDAVPG
ncbi:MAG: MASE1 domain-containing protein [Pseudomonadota bacterium]